MGARTRVFVRVCKLSVIRREEEEEERGREGGCLESFRDAVLSVREAQSLPK